MNKFREAVENHIQKNIGSVAINTQGIITEVLNDANMVRVSIRNNTDSRIVKSTILPWPVQTNGIKTAAPEVGTLVSISFCDGDPTKPIISGVFISDSIALKESYRDEGRKPIAPTRWL
jgi:hypothetical protein